jgi:5-methylcytosine-specific restriction endonuclease McrA
MGRFAYLCGGCGRTVKPGTVCPCQIANDRARKARHDARRPSARERGYTSAWDKARAAFLEAHPTCATCGTPAAVVDHRIPHRGNHTLFWDRTNWQPLCTPCHSRAKQRLERQTRTTP